MRVPRLRNSGRSSASSRPPFTIASNASSGAASSALFGAARRCAGSASARGVRQRLYDARRALRRFHRRDRRPARDRGDPLRRRRGVVRAQSLDAFDRSTSTSSSAGSRRCREWRARRRRSSCRRLRTRRDRLNWCRRAGRFASREVRRTSQSGCRYPPRHRTGGRAPAGRVAARRDAARAGQRDSLRRRDAQHRLGLVPSDRRRPTTAIRRGSRSTSSRPCASAASSTIR